MTIRESSGPYRGSSPFRDDPRDRALFFGRENDASQITALTLSSPLTLLFGRSGLGKTSLINARLLSELRSREFFPVVTRVTELKRASFSGKYSTPISERIISQILAAARDQEIKVHVQKGESETLTTEQQTLWSFFTGTEFRNGNKSLRPVLIIDQFEELFSTCSTGEREDFVQELADLIRNRVPTEIRDRALRQIEQLPSDSPRRAELVNLGYGEAGRETKVFIALREDFLPDLQALKQKLPTIFRTTFRLMPLTEVQARQAIMDPASKIAEFGEQPFIFEPAAVDRIIEFLKVRLVGGKEVPGDSIEPMQLQILCQHLDAERRRRRRDVVTVADLGGMRGMRRIIRTYYRRIVRQFPRLRSGWNGRRTRPSLSNLIFVNFPRIAIGHLCETGLITPLRQRNSLEESVVARNFGVAPPDLGSLVDAYLLRIEPRLDGRFYELSHDSLVSMLVPLRRIRQLRTLALGMVCVISVVTYSTGEISTRFQDFQIERNYEIARDKAESVANRVTSIKRLSDATDVLKLSNQRFDNLDLQGLVARAAEFSATEFSNVNFDNARLPLVNFQRARFLEQVSFKDADLQNGRFDSARITLTTFAGANLEYAIFNDAFLGEVDFTGAALKNSSFLGAVTDDLTLLKGTDWWLARGWSSSRIEQFLERFPLSDFVTSPVFEKRKAGYRDSIASGKQNHDPMREAQGLNSLAWNLAIVGQDYQTAENMAKEALAISDNLRSDGNPSWRQEDEDNFRDTLAYILMLEGRWDDAENLETNVIKETQSRYLAEWRYHYALILFHKEKKDLAVEYLRQSREAGYAPSHEFVLLRTLPQELAITLSTHE